MGESVEEIVEGLANKLRTVPPCCFDGAVKPHELLGAEAETGDERPRGWFDRWFSSHGVLHSRSPWERWWMLVPVPPFSQVPSPGRLS
jgi:hypothetical protein